MTDNTNPCPIHEVSCLDCAFEEGRKCTWGEKKIRKWDSEEMTRIKALESRIERLENTVRWEEEL